MIQMTDAELAEKHRRTDMKSCARGEHGRYTPLFVDPRLGGLWGWRCACGAITERKISVASTDPGDLAG